MFALRLSAIFVLITFIIAAVMFRSSEAAYRKPPFNGSIFGKRNALDYDNAKIAAICEVAMDACQSWFPGNENK